MVLHTHALLSIALAVVLSLLIGAEREYFSKAAGMRTTTLVGLGSAVFTVVSREGLWLLPGMPADGVDGSRVAAQVVTGIGFLGAGLIFVRRDSVRGLTTAAGMWFVASVGMAAGAGLPDIAIAATLAYLVITIGVRPLSARMPSSPSSYRTIALTYLDGKGVLRAVMETIGSHGVTVADLRVDGDDGKTRDGGRLMTVSIEVRGNGAALTSLAVDLGQLGGVESVEWRSRTSE